MLSKLNRTLDNASPPATKPSPVAYRRTSIPSIIPVSVATPFGASISSPARRAPLASLDPQRPFNNPLDDQMSPSSSSSSNAQLSYPLPDSQKDGDRAADIARAYIGRHIISRPLEDDPDQALQSARKRSVPGHGNSVRTLPYPYPRSLQQRPSNTPSTPSSRRPSLPSTQYPQPASLLYPDPPPSVSSPNSPLESPPHTSPVYLNGEDLYSGLSTFTFGAARPLPSPQGSDSSEMVSPLTRVPPVSSADRTPRPSIASSNGSARRTRAPKVSDPDEGDDEYDEDEDDAARGKTRSKMRAIDDGTRRPSLPTNAFQPSLSEETPPPLPSPSHIAALGHLEMSPGASSGQESGFEDSEADEGEPAEFDTDVEFDLQHGGTADPPISDTASQHTFGTGGYRHYVSAQHGDGLNIRERDDEEDSNSISPVTFTRDDGEHNDVDVLDDPESPGSPGVSTGYPVVTRRGSVPWNIPGTASTRSRDGALLAPTGRDREDSTATVVARRASRSVDDDLGSTAMDTDIQPISHDQPSFDFRANEAQHAPQIERTDSEEAQAIIQQEEFQYGDFDLNYILGSEGRQSWSSDRPSYIEPHNLKGSGAVSALAAEWDAPWASGRRPSTVTVGSGDDVFTRQVRHWDEIYAQRKVEWSFKKENTDGRGPQRLSISSSAPPPLPETKSQNITTMPPGSQELWRQAFVGRFKVDRIRLQSDQPGKAAQQRLNIRHIQDPYSKGNTRGGPGAVIHKHSRAIAFSIFRNHALFNRHKQNRPTMNTSASILLATKKVQEQYTSTRTTSKLNSHGLLEDVPRHADGTTVYSQSATVVASSSRSRPSTPGGPQAGRNDEYIADRRRAQNGEAGPSDTHDETQRVSLSPTPPPLPPKEEVAHRTALSVSTVDSAHASDDGRIQRSVDNAQPSASTDHESTVYSFSNSSRSFSGHGEPMDIEEDEQSPPRTSHAEAFAAVDSSYLEHIRNRSEPRHPEESSSHSILGAMRRRLLGQGGAKSPSITPPTAPRESNYQPPWLTMAPRSKQEERERVIQNLNESFKDVGLLPTVRPGKSSLSTKGKRRKHPSSTTNIFEQVPADSLYMLLPLWPGETDQAASDLQEDPSTYVVPLEERQFLLVYYVPFDADSKKKGDSGKKRARTEARTSSSTSNSNVDRLISLQTFRVCARLVSYADLRETGVRVPACGLSITGSMTEAVENLPPPSIREQRLDDVVIGLCNARAAGMEFLPEGLKKVGLCVPTEAPAPPVSEMEQVPEEIAVLTPLGRAAVEMAWLGGMAVTSFGSI